MLIDFEQLDEREIKNFYGGTQSTMKRAVKLFSSFREQERRFAAESRKP